MGVCLCDAVCAGHQRLNCSMVVIGGCGYVLHVCLNLWQDIGGGGGCGVSRFMFDGASSVCASKGDITFLVRLVCVICCSVSDEEGFTIPPTFSLTA